MYMRSVLALGLATTVILTGGASAQETAKAPADASQVATTDPLPNETEPSAAPTATPVPEPQDPLGIALKQLLTSPPSDDGDEQAQADVQPQSGEQSQADVKALTTFYQERTFAPVWVSKDGMTAKADAAIAEIKKADDWGLEAAAFALPEPVATATPEALAEAEITLSKAVLKYARYARGGRIMNPAEQLSSYLDRMPQLLDPQDVMTKIAASDTPDAVLRGFHPQHPQFEKLRQQLLALRKASTADEMVRLPDGPLLKPGMSHPDVALLRKRLKVPPPATEPAPEATTSADAKPAEGAPKTTASLPKKDESFYDDALVVAVKAFQKEKGLSQDGLVGRGTRAALNDFEVLSADKLIANMEEWRWMPEDMGDLYVQVNVPEFKVRVVKNGTVIHSERVITGKVDKQTPIFSHDLKTIYAKPRWNVPNSIKVNELYPSLVRGSDYFQRQGLRLSHNGRIIDPDDVDWDETDIRRFDVYQPAGPRNALGVVKFAFPNKHLVYMHDTPTKSLFNRSVRTFSHGCMRVRNPRRLAEILLGEDKGWDAAKVDDIIENGPRNNDIEIEHRIPVHVTYFTAWVDDQGETQMARDVYGHEKRITLALAGKWDQIDKGPNHLAPVRLKTVDNGWSFFGGGSGKRRRGNSVGDYVQSVLGGGF
jgi:murein L,D-transpeptidase YcbB/YkuD